MMMRWCVVNSESAERTAEIVAISDVAACRTSIPRRPRPSSGQISQGHPDAAVLSGRLDAGALQHRPAARPRHVHICHLRHVVLHAREKDERLGRGFQLRDIHAEHDHSLPGMVYYRRRRGLPNGLCYMHALFSTMTLCGSGF